MFKHLTLPEFLRRFETIDARCCSECAALRLDLLAWARMHLLVMEPKPIQLWEVQKAGRREKLRRLQAGEDA